MAAEQRRDGPAVAGKSVLSFGRFHTVTECASVFGPQITKTIQISIKLVTVLLNRTSRRCPWSRPVYVTDGETVWYICRQVY